jgi:hypothetical protein
VKTVTEKTASAASGRELLRMASRTTVVITTKGRPRFAIVALPKGEDIEDFATASSPVFRRIVRDSVRSYKQKGGISHAEVKRRLGIK